MAPSLRIVSISRTRATAPQTAARTSVPWPRSMATRRDSGRTVWSRPVLTCCARRSASSSMESWPRKSVGSSGLGLLRADRTAWWSLAGETGLARARATPWARNGAAWSGKAKAPTTMTGVDSAMGSWARASLKLAAPGRSPSRRTTSGASARVSSRAWERSSVRSISRVLDALSVPTRRESARAGRPMTRTARGSSGGAREAVAACSRATRACGSADARACGLGSGAGVDEGVLEFAERPLRDSHVGSLGLPTSLQASSGNSRSRSVNSVMSSVSMPPAAAARSRRRSARSSRLATASKCRTRARVARAWMWRRSSSRKAGELGSWQSASQTSRSSARRLPRLATKSARTPPMRTPPLGWGREPLPALCGILGPVPYRAWTPNSRGQSSGGAGKEFGRDGAGIRRFNRNGRPGSSSEGIPSGVPA